jgi:hypothetical protein
MKKVTTLLAVMALMATMVLPAVASAEGTGYSSTAAQVESTVQSNPKPAAAEQHSGDLPFTGLEVFAVAGAGLALLATGLGLRKAGGARSAG